MTYSPAAKCRALKSQFGIPEEKNWDLVISLEFEIGIYPLSEVSLKNYTSRPSLAAAGRVDTHGRKEIFMYSSNFPVVSLAWIFFCTLDIFFCTLGKT